VVDALDYTVWRNNEGTNVELPNDPIGGTIGSGQYDQWRENYGNVAAGAGSGGTAGLAIPEPGCMVTTLIMMCCLGMTSRLRVQASVLHS
jgi:hypothetical protein